MANLKTKSSKFISLSGEMEPGGAPIFADDIIRVQENDQADILNFFEASRRLLPDLLTWDGATLSKQFENGLILSGLEYDNTDPANPVVSEGYILSGGEVCYYPGGTIATGLVNRGLLYLYKGAANNTARVFNIGGSKNILVSHDIVIEQGAVTVNGLELDGSTAITATDDVVVLGIGIAGAFYGEDYFTTRAAQKVTELGLRASESQWSAATLAATVTLGAALPYFVSRVNSDGTTEIHGSLSIPSALQTGSSPIVATLSSFNCNTTGSIGLSAYSQGKNIELIIAGNAGVLRIIEPSTGWPGGILLMTVSVKVFGNTTLETPYVYNSDFLNIT